MEAQVLLHIEHTQLGEGPVWDYRDEKLWWVDIKANLLHCFDPKSGKNKSYDLGQYVGAVVPCRDKGLILALHHGFAFFDATTEKLEWISDPESHIPSNRFNDGKCDPAGRFWAGTMNIGLPRKALGSLYCLDTSLEVSQKRSEIYISNGLAWTKDHSKMFYIDTIAQSVEAYDYDIKTGEISNPSIALSFDREDWPDGMCIDEHDHLWIAFYGGGKICCYDPISHKKLDQIDVDAACTTSCAFGGKNLDLLYITSAADAGDVNGGALFVVEPGVKGRKANFFLGR